MLRSPLDEIERIIINKDKLLLTAEQNVGSYLFLKLFLEKFDVDLRVIIFSFLGQTNPKIMALLIRSCRELGADYLVFEAEDIASLVLHRLKPYLEQSMVFADIIRGAIRNIILTNLALPEKRVPIVAKSLTDLVLNPEPKFKNIIYPFITYTDSQLIQLADSINIKRAIIDKFSRKTCELGEVSFEEVDKKIYVLLNTAEKSLCEKINISDAKPNNLEELLVRNICMLRTLGWDIWKYDR